MRIKLPMKLYAQVKLLTDKYDILDFGATGYIIEIYENDMYEVEFSNPQTGETIAQIVIPSGDIEEIQDA
jgi:hypothetical protein